MVGEPDYWDETGYHVNVRSSLTFDRCVPFRALLEAFETKRLVALCWRLGWKVIVLTIRGARVGGAHPGSLLSEVVVNHVLVGRLRRLHHGLHGHRHRKHLVYGRGVLRVLDCW